MQLPVPVMIVVSLALAVLGCVMCGVFAYVAHCNTKINSKLVEHIGRQARFVAAIADVNAYLATAKDDALDKAEAVPDRDEEELERLAQEGRPEYL